MTIPEDHIASDAPAPTWLDRLTGGMRYALTGKAPDSWFGPHAPPPPTAPQTAGRMFDYPSGYNLLMQPRAAEPISFAKLRMLADQYDLLRLVIETRKDQMANLSWALRSRSGKPTHPRLASLTAFFQSPDGEHGWDGWLRMLLEDLLVIDAPTLYPARDGQGRLVALEPVDGATIKRVLDERGRTPLPPWPAYQQVLKGMVTANYRRDELIYAPRNPRSHRIYGYSPVEQIITTVEIALKRQAHQLAYYTEGNVPEALIGVPENWSPDQIGQFQAYWDSLMEGDLAQRRHARFVPATISKSFVQTKDAALKDEYDEWLARIICYGFSVAPGILIRDANRATAETNLITAHQEGLLPLMRWVKTLMDRLLRCECGAPDLEFIWTDDISIAPLVQAQIDQIYLNAQVISPADVRQRLGLLAPGPSDAVSASS